jgi:hypothetical protein
LVCVFTCILASSRITWSGSWRTDPSFLRWFCHNNSYYIQYIFYKFKIYWWKRIYKSWDLALNFLYIRGQLSVHRFIHLWCQLQICSTIYLRAGCFSYFLEFLEHLPFQQVRYILNLSSTFHVNMDYTWFGYYKTNSG